MVEIQEDVTNVDERVVLLKGDVNFLFDETVIQDERIYNLEQDSDVFDDEIESKCSPYPTCKSMTVQQIRFNVCFFWYITQNVV